MSDSALMGLAAYACATTFSPGPNNILLLSSTSRFGLRRCLPLMAGIATGLVTIMLACGFGCAWLGELAPQIAPYAKFAGAAYILWLAWKTLFRGAASGGGEVRPLNYLDGFMLQFFNVKILLLGVAAYTGFILPYGFRVPYVLAFAAVMAGCAVTGNLIWSTLGTLLCPIYNRYCRAVNLLMAALLIWCACKMLLV
jgi:Putative threonine efflux protein